jgi:hypothetical protein
LCFVWLGEKLPDYAHISLRLATQHSHVPTVLLCNKDVGTIDFVTEQYFVEDFYTRDDAIAAAKENYAKHYDINFWNDYWFKTLERYFILLQFMRHYKAASFFQAELDNLIFDIHDLPDILDKMGKGVFIPRINKETAAGSLIYTNSEDGINALCACAVKCSKDGLNDMQILARFLDSSVYGITLPSEKTIVEGISYPTKIGIFDSHLLGLCIFGLDGRIHGQLVKNRLPPFFAFDNPQRQLNELQISINLNKSIAVFSYPSTKEDYNIRNLHIHSKIFYQINNSKRLQHIQRTFNAGKSIIIYCDYKYQIKELPRRLIVMLKKIIKNLLPYFVVKQYKRFKTTPPPPPK